MQLYVQETLIGTVGIAEQDGCISNLYFKKDKFPSCGECSKSALLVEAFRQLNSYLKGDISVFSLPLAPAGTSFMLEVWQALCRIPYGKTSSYKEIAVVLGNPRASRAVGMANRRNPLPVFVPCHRVIGSDGTLTGYRGGLALKKVLLDLERRAG